MKMKEVYERIQRLITIYGDDATLKEVLADLKGESIDKSWQEHHSGWIPAAGERCFRQIEQEHHSGWIPEDTSG